MYSIYMTRVHDLYYKITNIIVIVIVENVEVEFYCLTIDLFLQFARSKRPKWLANLPTLPRHVR